MVINQEQSVYIPHLGYTVRLVDARYATGKAREKLGDYIAVTHRDSPYQSTVYFRLPAYDDDFPTLCHEILHVVQFICRDYGINFWKEREHIAYLFQFILSEFLKDT